MRLKRGIQTPNNLRQHEEPKETQSNISSSVTSPTPSLSPPHSPAPPLLLREIEELDYFEITVGSWTVFM